MAEPTQAFPGAFCESCNKWREPNTVMPDGSCPRCGTVIDAGAPTSEQVQAQAAQVNAKIPWHFWLMVAATALYLGWRVIQGVGSLF